VVAKRKERLITGTETANTGALALVRAGRWSDATLRHVDQGQWDCSSAGVCSKDWAQPKNWL